MKFFFIILINLLFLSIISGSDNNSLKNQNSSSNLSPKNPNRLKLENSEKLDPKLHLKSVKWQLPKSSRRYNEITFLTSHNSFSNQEDGYIQPQQKWSIQKQLDNGVRAFMLDTHYSSNFFSGKKKVRLCHRNCTLTQAFLMPFSGKPMSFTRSLKIFKKFLEDNKQEIITLFLENYTNAHDLDEAIGKANIEHLIFKPTDWCFCKNPYWPTLRSMQIKNKRLVLFNQKGETKFAFNEWKCHAENQFGTTNISKALQERIESNKAGKRYNRYLYVLNYFPRFYVKSLQSFQALDFKKFNSENIKRLLNSSIKHGLGQNKICRSRYPNFIAVDFVNEGNLLETVNKINSRADNLNKRKSMYRTISKAL